MTKLSLNRETILSLHTPDLDRVAGGTQQPTEQWACGDVSNACGSGSGRGYTWPSCAV